MRLDPGGDILAQNAFATDNGCPVCHSMSAQGNKFVTADIGWSTNGGVSNVDAAGNLTVLGDAIKSPYSDGANDWRGFAWAPLTPDGQYIFATNNIWGNSKQELVGINGTTRQVELPTPMASGGTGTGLQASYYTNNGFLGWSWRRIDPHVDYDWSASPGGPVPANNFSADLAQDGFTNNAIALTVSPALAEQYMAASEALASACALDRLSSSARPL
jgi:hypothetical protein